MVFLLAFKVSFYCLNGCFSRFYDARIERRRAIFETSKLLGNMATDSNVFGKDDFHGTTSQSENAATDYTD